MQYTHLKLHLPGFVTRQGSKMTREGNNYFNLEDTKLVTVQTE